MTNFSAWDEFDPRVTKELRAAIRTGDFSAFDPEVADAFGQALRTLSTTSVPCLRTRTTQTPR